MKLDLPTPRLSDVPPPVRHGLNDTVRALDDVGFDVGHHHVSLWSGLQFVFVMVLVVVFARLGTRLVHRFLLRLTSLEPAQRVLAEKVAGIAIWAVALLVGLDALGINLTALTVFSGALGLAVGFGLQKAFGNLIAGMILLLDRSIQPGDVIAVNDGKGQSFGQVKKIGFRAVSIATGDNRVYLIPNETLMTGQVENWSYASPDVAIQIPVSVAHGCDLAQVERLLITAARTPQRVMATPDPAVNVLAIGAGSIDLQISCWIADPANGVTNVKSEVLKAVLRLFAEHGVAFPSTRQTLVLGAPVGGGEDAADGARLAAAMQTPPSAPAQ